MQVFKAKDVNVKICQSLGLDGVIRVLVIGPPFRIKGLRRAEQ
jgi:hypothetical protein